MDSVIVRVDSILKDFIKSSKVYQKYVLTNKILKNKKRFERLQPSEWIGKQHLCYLTRRGKMIQLEEMLQNITVQIRDDSRFQSWINVDLYIYNKDSLTDNTSPNYNEVVHASLKELKKVYGSKENFVCRQNSDLLCIIENYIDRIVSEFEKAEASSYNNTWQLKKSKMYFQRMKYSPAESLEEALQRIIFWSTIFWQSGHRLVGLGRLDKILAPFSDECDKEKALAIIKDFYNEMHRFYAYKSNKVAMGDTGQVIVLAGKEEDGSYFYNRLTYLFIEALKEYNLPDPKIILRVSRDMPQGLLEIAVKCIATGVGSPLLSNDDVIIPSLEEFGYNKKDAANYVTSACWEPLAYGKSLEKNNLRDINYAEVLVKTYQDDAFLMCDTFESIVELFASKLEEMLQGILKSLDKIKWEPDPLMTLFTEGCVDKGKDISQGGAVYNNYGILSVGLANAVNSLLFIKHAVFIEKKYSLEELSILVKCNYTDAEIIRREIEQKSNFFGHDTIEVIDITKKITGYVHDICSNYKTPLGGKIKWGLSSSNYQELGKNTAATLDGRKSGQALAVHISSIGDVAYTELVQFATKINYSGQGANGNVVDFFVSPVFIMDNFEKFVQFIRLSINTGFFQMQLNVVSSETLIQAKNNPEDFPDLIVRVWGFSAYFKDLPEEYKDILIKRALQSEGKWNG